jgi:hypothetical protein
MMLPSLLETRVIDAHATPALTALSMQAKPGRIMESLAIPLIAHH